MLRLSARVASGQAAAGASRALLPRGAPPARRAPGAARAASGAAPAAAGGNATEAMADAYSRLAGAKAYLVSTRQLVEVASLWGEGDRTVLFFARHMVRARARPRRAPHGSCMGAAWVRPRAARRGGASGGAPSPSSPSCR